MAPRQSQKTNMDASTRVCARCDIEKPFDAFHRNRRDRVAGRQSYCIQCQAGDRTKRREADPNYHKGLFIKHKYGISYEIYERMLKEQDGKCAICEGEETATYKGTVRALGVDHCHTTGVVRGLLCHRCNVAIGLLSDNLDHLQRAINYLRKDG